MVQLYSRKWRRGILSSLICYIRDAIVLILPIKRLPDFLIKLLYGLEVKFVFLVHPRNYQDVFISAPFLKPIKLLLRKSIAFRLVSRMNPFVLNTVWTKQGVNGFVIAQLTVPEIMFEQRTLTLDMLRKALLLASKISGLETVVGLGGWFPMISRRGVSLVEYAKSLGLRITNGHGGTLASIYMTVEKIAKIGNFKLEELSLAIIGVGKMGANVAKVFNNDVKRLVLVDINGNALEKLKGTLRAQNSKTQIEAILSTSNISIRDVLKKCHLGICATSSVRNLVKLRDLPNGFIMLDDSRPEAIPRDPKKEKIVLEGGLLKIKDVKINYDYGLGQDENVFGCLGEAFLLALDQSRILNPTLGDVEMNNFFNLLEFCKRNKVTEGDFKSSNYLISAEDVRDALSTRHSEIKKIQNEFSIS